MKSLKTYSVSAEVFNKILSSFTWKEFKEDLTPFLYGHAKKNCIYYNDTDLVTNLLHLSVLGLTEETENDSWYQVFLHKEIEQVEPIIIGLKPTDAIIKVNSIIKKHYTNEQKEEIFKTHERNNSEIIHLPIDAEKGIIKRFDNCVYYDANGAYASELIKLFPECEDDFMYMFEHRHDNNNRFKNVFNYYVGCLTQNEKKREAVIAAGKTPRKTYTKTRHYIVQNITNMLLALKKEANGYNVYANTDGIIIQEPKNKIPGSKDLGTFKIEYEGTVYTYAGDNYVIVQYGDEIKGSLPLELRKYVDLRKGLVVSYDRVQKSDGTYQYLNIKQENKYEEH